MLSIAVLPVLGTGSFRRAFPASATSSSGRNPPDPRIFSSRCASASCCWIFCHCPSSKIGLSSFSGSLADLKHQAVIVVFAELPRRSGLGDQQAFEFLPRCPGLSCSQMSRLPTAQRIVERCWAFAASLAAFLAQASCSGSQRVLEHLGKERAFSETIHVSHGPAILGDFPGKPLLAIASASRKSAHVPAFELLDASERSPDVAAAGDIQLVALLRAELANAVDLVDARLRAATRAGGEPVRDRLGHTPER